MRRFRFLFMMLLMLAANPAWVAGTSAESGLPATAATPAPALEATRSAPREVILVRHGHYAVDPSIDEAIGPGLSPLGFAQARLVGARLAAEYPALDGRHVSPMQRARDTAAAIAIDVGGADFEAIDDLAECTPPTRRQDVMARVDPASAAACQARLDRLFERLFGAIGEPGRSDLYVCHGNVIRYLVTRALGVDTEAWLELSVGHASLTRIRVEGNGRYKVVAVGDVGHLPRSLRTGASGDSERPLLPVEGFGEAGR